MKILILGAGRVGSSVVESLASEQNDITVIDNDKGRLVYLHERFDIRVVFGDGSLPDVLEEAGAPDTDLIVACAASDAVNLVACKIARDVFNTPKRIARIRSNYYVEHADFAKENFGVDSIISPENSVTDYLHSLIEFPEALQLVELSRGLVSVMALKVGVKSHLIRMQIDQDHLNLPDLNGRILQIMRYGEVLPLERTFRLQPNDEMVLAVDTTQAKKTIRRLISESQTVRNIMIAGGGNIGSRLAAWLAQEHYNVRIIETDPQQAEQLSAMLPDSVIVLQGNGTDEALLANENISSMDTWLALTNNDEDNIMSSLLAKRLGARKVIALISRQAYGELMQGSMIDIAVSPALATIGALLKDVKQGTVISGHRLMQGDAEVMEFVVIGTAENSNIIDRQVGDIHWPKTSVLAAIVRGEEVIVPENTSTISADDHVIMFAPNRKVMQRVEKLFQVSAMFL